MSLPSRPGRSGVIKSIKKSNPIESKDWHVTLGASALKAEKAADSLERMLAVCRALIAFLSHAVRPGTRYQDTPTAILGNHYLSQRELGIYHRGDITRLYLQEICSRDPNDAPIPFSEKYSAPNHTDVTTWNLKFTPVAKIRFLKEQQSSILPISSGSTIPCIQVALQDASGFLSLIRHDELYVISALPSLVLTSPLSEECPLEYDGQCVVECSATGLRSILRFTPSLDNHEAITLKGEVKRLTGSSNDVNIARMEGQWQNQIMAYGLENTSEGVLYNSADFFPKDDFFPAVINLKQPGPRTVPRLWSAILEAIIFMDTSDLSSRQSNFIDVQLPDVLRNSLLYGGKRGGVLSSHTLVPPIIRDQRKSHNRPLTYQLQYIVQSLNQFATEQKLL